MFTLLVYHAILKMQQLATIKDSIKMLKPLRLNI